MGWWKEPSSILVGWVEYESNKKNKIQKMYFGNRDSSKMAVATTALCYSLQSPLSRSFAAVSNETDGQWRQYTVIVGAERMQLV